LLCRPSDEAEAVRTVLGKIARLDENSRADTLQRLEILSGLRPLKATIQREVGKMPITLNLRDNPFSKRPSRGVNSRISRRASISDSLNN
jgi:hypothetical protein